MERISYTFDMMRSSWEVLKAEKQLVLFPLISGVCCVLVLLSFGLPLLGARLPEPRSSCSRGRCCITGCSSSSIF